VLSAVSARPARPRSPGHQRSTASIAAPISPGATSGYGNVLPDVITIYQGPIQEDADSLEDMGALVQDTVVHEIGHYFGLDDDRLEALEEE
jgi:hypothetical protein